MKHKSIISLTMISMTLWVSCIKKKDPAPSTTGKDAINTYADIAYASYKDSYEEAVKLQNGIIDFCATPSQEKFQNLKTLYINARYPYNQTEAFRTANGPIDTGDDAVEGRINPWPLSENFVDYVDGNDSSGIINDTKNYPTISKETLISNHESGGEANLTLGYHVIEFLLWGQDLNPESNKNAAGQRKFTDYTTLKNAARRKQYLQAATEILVEDLKYLVDQWAPNGPYRNTFLALPEKEALTNMYSGIAWYCAGELPTERMAKAVKEADQEEEHSCFSDQTDQDIKISMKGVRNLLDGNYIKVNGETVKGKGLLDYLREHNSTGANLVDAKLADATSKCSLIPAPFDQAIINSPKTVQEASASIYQFSTDLTSQCFIMGLTLNIPQ